MKSNKKASAPVQTILTNLGLMRCTVAELEPGSYIGLKRGLGKTRLSSKHHPSNAAKTAK